MLPLITLEETITNLQLAFLYLPILFNKSERVFLELWYFDTEMLSPAACCCDP